MHSPQIIVLLSLAALTSGLPFFDKRTVTSLNQAAFEEAQKRDATATRAFSAVEIKNANGKCLFVNQFSGDFRANLNPIQVAACDGSTGQKWDVITKGKHNNEKGTMLVVNTLTQACMNFDPRRAAGNQVIMFSCGGRADGSGAVTNSQLFTFLGSPGPDSFEPENATGTCFTIKGDVLDKAPCVDGSRDQLFTFGNGVAAGSSSSSSSAPASTDAVATKAAVVSSPAEPACDAVTVTVSASASDAAPPPASSAAPPATTSSTTSSTTSTSAKAAPPATTAPPAGTLLTAQPTTPVPVSRAGGTLNPSDVAQSNPRDNTAVRAFSSVPLKSGADGLCLSIDLTAGDFRENLIPVALKPCDGSVNQAFDIITAGVHNNAANSALVVSSLTQGCLNFDSRRAARDTVIMFACGGRADGSGQVTNSQLFPFKTGAKSILLAPENENGATCLVPNGALLDEATCSGSAAQLFTIG